MENSANNIKYAVLDLASVAEGQVPADTFKNSLELAQHAEQLGYSRYWFAEHHNMVNVASSATAVLIGYVAGGTNSIRVGSGGIMLPNHAPLVVAEQFGTLASLYPGRIDLGLGRAPGSDQLTALAIRGENIHAAENFPADVQRLQMFFSAENSTSKVRAIPGEGLDIPIWILGSSPDSAYLAAAMGLPYAFASHFAPTHFLTAIDIYRQNFKPSKFLDRPYVLSCINVIAADTDEEAEYQSTSLKQFFMGVVTGKRQLLQPPVQRMEDVWSYYEQHAVGQMLTYLFTGGPEKLKQDIKNFIAKTQVDEVMVTSHIFEHTARLRSYEIFADVMKSI
ncbi:LLM class flavin-dependent oxidoreductase [Mucilaginibacter sp. Bleaf8]|uniref:LLM class flavin-dependent oxidoreductase n=1 Tax=Mucilaginibacter sp. Bleaf8 TaxID=2834430 RepID=UPI001BD162DD|nr:LLM class flavin-dependent oxidoreductase [Mucilaginibacter sp. Bleaf8]MBS7562947.1 LLM class flavin-dependent oxidoreductase [Mucilaginibacter sp. Bleaf8]